VLKTTTQQPGIEGLLFPLILSATFRVVAQGHAFLLTTLMSCKRWAKKPAHRDLGRD